MDGGIKPTFLLLPLYTVTLGDGVMDAAPGTHYFLLEAAPDGWVN